MNTVTIDGMSRYDCAMMMAFRAIDNLKSAGFVEGGSHDITDKGKETAARLDAAGFEFNPGELESICKVLFPCA